MIHGVRHDFVVFSQNVPEACNLNGSRWNLQSSKLWQCFFETLQKFRKSSGSDAYLLKEHLQICVSLVEAEVRSSVQNTLPCVKPRPSGEEVYMVPNGRAARFADAIPFRKDRRIDTLVRNYVIFQPLPI